MGNKIIIDAKRALYILSGAKNTQKIDLRTIEFVTPFLITPIVAFMNSSSEIYKLLKSEYLNVNQYLDIIEFPHSIDLNSEKKIKENSNYIPLFQFSKKNAQYDKKIADICDKIITSHCLKSNQNIMISFLSELFDNIKEHSESQFNFIYFQKYRDNMAISIVDKGITIPGSYEKNKIQFKNDVEALKFVLKGISTKKQLKDERGTGIPNTLNWICKGLEG